MEMLRVRAGEPIAKKNEKVRCWYLIQEGSVKQRFEEAEMLLRRNSIIGFLERDVYHCDYVAAEDCAIASFVCDEPGALKQLLSGSEKLRSLFLRAVIEQRYQLLSLYVGLDRKVKNYHTFVETVYNEYKTFCGNYGISETAFPRMEHFNAIEMQHKVETWERDRNVSLVKNYMDDYIQLMGKDDAMTVGAILEGSAQMRRFALGVAELESYLTYNKGIMLVDTQSDLFRLFVDLVVKMQAAGQDVTPVMKDIQLMLGVAAKLDIYDPEVVNRAGELYQRLKRQTEGQAEAGVIEAQTAQADIKTVDCLGQILDYAGYTGEQKRTAAEQIRSYAGLPDRTSMDKDVYALRKQVTALFYDLYEKAFFHSMEDADVLSPVLKLFFQFGFVDCMFLEDEQADVLYDLAAHLELLGSDRVFTIYRWLECIYNGRKTTSKNEFDMDYPAYLLDEKKHGRITEQQLQEYRGDCRRQVSFEIHNMFASVNKITYGRISTFCPILCAGDLVYAMDRMLVTAEKIENALNEVRRIDYSIFFREVMFSDPEHGINCEKIMKEILPDIILMPNAGTRGIMWQEASGVSSATPGRFMFPVFTTAEIQDLVLETAGAFRWEICRKVQGMRWNDIREKSLTAEYSDYIQFYRKNHDLSADAKEKLKSALVRAKNNYREVFTRDYVNWIRFEAKGSFRLNKVARDILARYCPFAKAIRNELRTNPLYQNSVIRFEAENAQKLQRYQNVYKKYEKAGGEITLELKENMAFFQM